jgi:hypothetical protein
MSYWFVKTDYISKEGDRDLLLANLPEMNWGENYPK